MPPINPTVSVFVIALIKIVPATSDELQKSELDKVLLSSNAIETFTVPGTDVTHIIVYAFRDVEEYDNYFKNIRLSLGNYVEIRDTYVLSTHSMMKSSSKEVFKKILSEKSGL